MNKWKVWDDNLVELIRLTSSSLPRDIESALQKALRREKKNSPARLALEVVLENIRLARERGAPLCQDTGSLIFYVRVPAGFDVEALSSAIRSAVRQATRQGYLRQNTVYTVNGNVCGTNIGPGAPVIHIQHSRGARAVDIRLIMKGGGSENASAQYSLPHASLGAGRDPDGVRRCALDAVLRAQGNGCAPGVLGICVGGDRATGAEFAKQQLLRRLDHPAPDRQLAQLERRILKQANVSGIGPMGLGGATTLLGVKIGALTRLPASYFVSIAYMCWAFRRRGVVLRTDGRIQRRLY